MDVTSAGKWGFKPNAMNRIIRYRDRIETVAYSLFFPVHSAGHGYGFDCDAQGNVDADKLNPAARANFEMCKRDHAGIAIVQTIRGHDIEPGLMKCDCGRTHEIWDHHDITCEKCGRSYNSAGQQLAHPSQWGEETGETAGDYWRGVGDPEGAFSEDY